MPELVQENAATRKVLSTASSSLRSPERVEKMVADLKDVQLKIEEIGASNKVATHILELN